MPGEDLPERNVIACTPSEKGHMVRVDDCVGVIGTEAVQLTIEPKIPLRHFIHLLQHTQSLPRFGEERVWLSGEWTIIDLLCAWFLNAAEAVFRRGLLSDYVERREDLAAPRGRINVLGTAAHYYNGRVCFDCEYDEFDEDIAINRVLLAAAMAIRRNPLVLGELRTRARRAAFRLDGVGDLKEGDLTVEVDSRTKGYATGLLLAKAILLSETRSFEHGNRTGWAFLIPTPILIELAIRKIVQRRIPEGAVQKRGLTLRNKVMTVNPDLVFERHCAVGDVKYKHFTDGWPRADLYQSVAFAAAFEVERACVVSFQKAQYKALPQAEFGTITISHVGWNQDIEDPNTAEVDFAHRLREWLFHRGAREDFTTG